MLILTVQILHEFGKHSVTSYLVIKHSLKAIRKSFFFLLRYNEVCHYDFTSYQSTGLAPVGHFTQMVWKGTKKFGIARVFKGDSQSKCVYVVARYSPKKVRGQEDDNIDKGRFTPAVCRLENKNGKGATLTQSKLHVHEQNNKRYPQTKGLK